MGEIRALPKYQEWLECLEADPVVSRHVNAVVGTRGSAIHRSDWDYLSWFLTRQLTFGSEFTPETFEQMYVDLEEFFYSDKVTLRAFSPLQNFASESALIDLGNGLRIRKMEPEELEGLLNRDLFSAFSSMQLHRAQHAAEFVFEAEKIAGDFPKGPPGPFEEQLTLGKLVTALRLFEPGNVGVNLIVVSSLADNPAIGSNIRGGGAHELRLGPRCQLSKEEADQFRDFWHYLSTIDLNRPAPLSIAISRFNDGYERRKLQDRLIDYMIAFEALLYKKGERGEFRHKLAVRTARLLAEDRGERDRIAKEMRDFYDRRSQIVHGTKTSFDRKFVDKVEGYLRRSVREFLERLKDTSHDEVISHLDLD
ncbi:MAG: hypothetical protein ACE5IJ_01640 [Thermoplasmata archaeon]